jgi:hypothetical protein
MQHSRPVTRYQIDLTDAEWRVIAPTKRKVSLRPLVCWQLRISQKRKATKPPVQQNPLGWLLVLAGADVGIEADHRSDAVSLTALALCIAMLVCMALAIFH